MIATREAALAKLQRFLPHAGVEYTQRRNHDRGPGAHHAVSQLSAYLRHRLLSEHELVDAVLRMHPYAAAEKFIQEVCWRSYWKGWLQQRPSVWRDYCEDRERARAALDADAVLRDAHERAVTGQTGIAAFDHWCAELRDTGYLHNHARMWFASIWIFTLRLPWVLGADHFMQQLCDADAASNTLSWRWVGGLQTPGKHYLARAENIAKYTEGRFDPRGQLDEQAVALRDQRPLPPVQALPVLERFVPQAPWALLISDDDASLEQQWPRSSPAPFAIAVSTASLARRSPQGLGAPALAFAQNALDDALQRAQQRWPQARVCGSIEALEAQLRARPGAQLVLAEPSVGPAADALQAPEAQWRAQGIAVRHWRRAWDAAFWPRATRGFFAFREHIPDLLRRLSGESADGAAA